MRVGLVIGKFMPLHYGHVGLIRFALEKCSVLKIAIVTRDEDCIHPDVRKQWISSIFEAQSERIIIDVIDEALPRTDGHTPDAFLSWATYFRLKYTEVDVIISSEAYAETLSEIMSIEHVFYDPSREQVSISASEILKNPIAYQSFLPEVVFNYFNSNSNSNSTSV